MTAQPLTLATATGLAFTVAIVDAQTLAIEVPSKGIRGTARHGAGRLGRAQGAATHGLTLDGQRITLGITADTAAQVNALADQSRTLDPAAVRRDLVDALDAAVDAEDAARERAWQQDGYATVGGPAVEAARAALAAHDAHYGPPVHPHADAVARALRGED